MKKIFYYTVIALTATLFASCGYKSVETPLVNGLICFSAQTEDGKIVYGVKDHVGKEIVPAQYEQISMYGNNILAINDNKQWLYYPDGSLWLTEPSESISEENGHILFYTLSEKIHFLPVNATKTYGPFKSIERHGSKFFFAQDDYGLGCTVYNENGQEILYGGRIIFLFSKADSKYYFIVLNDEKSALAFDDTGKELFALDRKKMKQFPAPEWTDISVEKIVIQNSLKAFKSLNQRKKR